MIFFLFLVHIIVDAFKKEEWYHNIFLMKTKTVYTIKIISAIERPNIWYAKKIGDTFDAELKPGPRNEPTDKAIMVFMVNPCQWVHLVDCEVLDKKQVPVY